LSESAFAGRQYNEDELVAYRQWVERSLRWTTDITLERRLMIFWSERNYDLGHVVRWLTPVDASVSVAYNFTGILNITEGSEEFMAWKNTVEVYQGGPTSWEVEVILT
jgi:hypothetical protein